MRGVCWRERERWERGGVRERGMEGRYGGEIKMIQQYSLVDGEIIWARATVVSSLTTGSMIVSHV